MTTYTFVGDQREGDQYEQGRVSRYENRGAYTLPSKACHEVPSVYQQPVSQGTGLQQQFTDGNCIDSQVKPKKGDSDLKGVKRCLCILSALVVIFLIISLAAIVMTVLFHFPNALTSTYNSSIATSLGQKSFSQMIVNIPELKSDLTMVKKQLNSLRGIIANFENQMNISIGTTADLRTSVTNLETQLSAINGQVTNTRNSITNLDASVTTINGQIANLITLSSSVTNLESRLNTISWKLRAQFSCS